MPNLTLEALPKEERDQAMGRYMDAFSRLENMVQVATHILLGLDAPRAGPIFATLMTKQLIDLFDASAQLILSEKGAARAKRLSEKLSRRNMRRNHIVHGYWTTYITFEDGKPKGQWVRRYDHVDPKLMKLEPIDPQLLGIYNFTVPELGNATDHVEEMVQALSALVEDIPSLLSPPPSPEEMLRMWVADRLSPNGGVALRLSQCRFP